MDYFPFVSIIFIRTYSCVLHALYLKDLPEFFEENMQPWMIHFDFLLNVNNPLLATGVNTNFMQIRLKTSPAMELLLKYYSYFVTPQPEDEAGLLDQLKSQICDNVGMYAQKYDEEFAPYLPKFVTNIWGLLVTTGSEPKYDLVCDSWLTRSVLIIDELISFIYSWSAKPLNF